jgi:hypothetical protein
MLPTPRTACIAIALLVLTGCKLSASPLVTACEIALKKRLAAPSKYRRISVTERQMPILLEAYLSENEPSETIRRFYRGMASEGLGEKPIKSLATIEYEAANTLGVPIRSFAECSYDSINKQTASEVSEHTVKVNGKTHSDYLLSEVKRLAR